MDRHNHHFHIMKHVDEALHNKFNDLVIADTFRLLALSIISIFIPIFLLDKIGLQLWEVVVFELASFVLCTFLHVYSTPLIGKIGVKKVMIFSYIMNALTCLFLYFGETIYTQLGVFCFLVLIVILNSLPLALYWTAHHIYFLKCSSPKNDGHKLGVLQSIPLVIGIAGPFLGSILITNYSYKVVFLFSTVLLILASFSLFFSQDIKIDIKPSFKKIIDTKHLRKNAVFFLQGAAYCATSFIWPVLLFFSSVKLVSMGFFYLLSNLLNGAMYYFGGASSDGKKSAFVLNLGALGWGLSIILRAIATTVFYMATFQSMGGLFGGLLNVGIDANFYKHSHHNIGNAIINRELYMHLGRIFTTLILISTLILYSPRNAFIATLLITGFSTFILIIIFQNKKSFMQGSVFDRFNIFD